ncbi:MAG: hypothetical protein F6K35_27560 [Okeania sp. SIO2H7]|nr:hypothetical protein [Okeania sp. SIO2H7]
MFRIEIIIRKGRRQKAILTPDLSISAFVYFDIFVRSTADDWKFTQIQSASDNETTIARSATVVERRIKSSILDASENEMTIAISATEVEVTPPTSSASENEMTIAISATEVEVTPPTSSASENEMTIATSATEAEQIIESSTQGKVRTIQKFKTQIK